LAESDEKLPMAEVDAIEIAQSNGAA